MRVSGFVRIDGVETPIRGHGLRDHSWGPRHWQAIDAYEWLTMNFGDDLGAMVSIIRKPGAPPRMGGVVVRGDDVDPIVTASIEIDFEPGTLHHRALSVSAHTRAGEHLEVEGRVCGYIPLRNRRDGRTTHVGEGMTEWRTGSRTGYGLSEVLRTFTVGDRPTPS